MHLASSYIFRQFLAATLFGAAILAGILLLTQSLRFMELVVESGASAGAFATLTLLALPRFFEVIFPLALLGGILFVYNRLDGDNELVALTNAGWSNRDLARPALMLGAAMAVFLMVNSIWLAPKTLAQMQHLRQVVKAQISQLLFREGVFTTLDNGLTVYVHERGAGGTLRGLMIHDAREDNPQPVTLLAQRGHVRTADEEHQVLVFDGARQVRDPETGTLSRLEFAKTVVEIEDPDGAVRQRWREPDERTLPELFQARREALANERPDRARQFRVEVHRRLSMPFLALSFGVLAAATFLLVPMGRGGSSGRIWLGVGLALGLQAVVMAAANFAHDSLWGGLGVMYAAIFLPLLGGLILLSPAGERLLFRFVFRPERRV